MRLLKRKEKLIFILFSVLLLTGCQKQVSLYEISEYASRKEYRTDGTPGEREEACLAFLRSDMIEQGGVYTRYLEETTGGELASGHEVLGESEGLLLRYAVQTENKELYQEIKQYIIKRLEKEDYLSYRVDEKGKAMEVNACIDDLRIIRGLYEGGDRELALRYGKQLKKTNLKKGLLVDYYTASDKRSGNEMTLCYGDLTTMSYLAAEEEEWQQILENTQKVMLEGYLGDEFPFFQTRYQIKKKSYETEDVFMVEALLTAYHLAEAGKCPKATIQWLENHLNGEGIYGRYGVDGTPVETVESTAVYAICMLIGQQTGNETIVKLAQKRMEQFQVMDRESEIYGAFGEAKTLQVYSFDNLMALMALRTTALPGEEKEPEEEVKADTLLICREKERKWLEPLIQSCGKQAEVLPEADGGVPFAEYTYIVTTLDGVSPVPYGKKLFSIGTQKAPGIAEKTAYQGSTLLNFSLDGFSQPEKEAEELFYIDKPIKGKSYGWMEFLPGHTAPYSIVTGNAGYASYLPEKTDLSTLALCAALEDFFDLPKKEGKMYVMMDEIFPFTEEKMLLKMGEDLHENGIPYLLRVMPVYRNLSYPEFTKWTGKLSYLQTKDAAVTLHEPIYADSTDKTEEELEFKKMTAENALENNGVTLYPMEKEPLRIDLDFLKTVKSPGRNLGAFPVDTLLVLPVYEEAEWEENLEFLKEKWIVAADWRKGEEPEDLYLPVEEEKDYTYRETPKVSMKSFFNQSNQVLLIIVSAAILIYILILVSSQHIYKNKFQNKKEQKKEEQKKGDKK